ncbi:MAG: M23 family metallopeptidase [Proteobacteria bacterium]|nr:M23 family metallopeptidase [Pseudomonadota bacterium]MBU1688643.1 M23 family metallopeptidase [Pseudomonadota bacterium]
MMPALKKFFKTYHFITLIVSTGLMMILISLAFEFGVDNQFLLRPALAKIPPMDQALKESHLPINQEFSSPEDLSHRITMTLQSGDTLEKLFSRHQVPYTIINKIVTALALEVNLKTLHPGDSLKLTLDQHDQLINGIFQTGQLNFYMITPGPDHYMVTQTPLELTRKTVTITGTILTSLTEAFPKDIKNPKLIYAFADIFASRFDFNTETRVGDQFSLMVEEYEKDGKFIGYGNILVARYQQNDLPPLEAFHYTATLPVAGYFDREGRQLGSSFIKSPVPLGRVSSRFTTRRKHPILGDVRKHLGIDLAAPTGTPIMATAEGKIAFIGKNGGFGNQIIIEHSNGYRTHYGHLSRFSKNLKKGSRVRQKEIIGFVGATGLATGPHLDYRLEVQGVFKNPFAYKYKPLTVLPDSAQLDFKQHASELINHLDGNLEGPFLQVDNVTRYPDSPLELL